MKEFCSTAQGHRSKLPKNEPEYMEPFPLYNFVLCAFGSCFRSCQLLIAFQALNYIVFCRFGQKGLYKALMFGSPSVIVTTPEACRRVLTDDEAFKPGWPTSTMKLIRKKSFISISFEEHKRLRKQQHLLMGMRNYPCT